jgi:hypothetical protein
MDEPPPAAPAPAASPAAAYLTAKYLSDKLDEAELLLGYAAVTGIAVDDHVRDAVLEARVASDAGKVTETAAANLLTALTALAGAVAPVTAESLRASANIDGARATIRIYGIMAGVVGLLIILISLATYFSSSVADKIKVDIGVANDLAAKLRSELGPSPSTPPAAAQPAPAVDLSQADKVWFGTSTTPPGLSDREVIGDLQQFAATVREINGYTRQLRFFVLDFDDSKYAHAKGSLELEPGLDVRLSEELTERVKEYQNVRSLGNSVQEKVTVYYGAIATCILPVLYALLGAGAYLLRLFEDEIRTRTLVAGNRHMARFLIAGIGGLVVGLFNNFTSQGITFSPFALAFLVGYAVDVFFTFLEGLLQIFKRGSGSAAAPAGPSGTSP